MTDGLARMRVTQGWFTRWWRDSEARLLPPLSYLVVVVLWEVAADTRILNPVFFSQPSAVITTGLHAMSSATFWNDTSTSVSEFLAGYSIAVAAGVALGVLMGMFRRFAYLLEPWVDALNATPSLALMPLVLIWFGIGGASKVAIVFYTAFIPVVLNVFSGVRTIDSRLLRVATSFGSSGLRLIRTVVVPSIAPFGFAGARIGVGRAVSGVVVGEFFAANSGLAFRIFRDAQVLDTASVLFDALVLTVLALAAFKFVGAVERRTLRWRSLSSGGGRSALDDDG